jgi:tetratricopeptide (TPR) repeat protein
MRILPFGFVCALALPLLAQSGKNNRIYGSITEQSSGHKPIANVRVKSAFANPVYSGNDGKYVLTFQELEPGENVIIEVQKDGWEVVNDKELQTLIPENASAKLLKIILCKAGQLAESRLKYYNISKAYITRRYEEKIAVLNKQADDWEKQAALLDEERRRLLQQARELAEQYSRIDFDDIAPLQRQAFGLFQQGKIKEAIQVLESVDSRKEIGRIQKEKQKWQALKDTAQLAMARADSSLQLQVKKLIFQAELYSQNYQFKEAETSYQLAAQTDTVTNEPAFQLAAFYYTQNEHEKSIRWYKRALQLTQTGYQAARIQNNLGILYKSSHEFALADSAYRQALRLYAPMARQKAAVYEADIATTYNNLGTLYQHQNKFAQAEREFNKALEISEQLTQHNAAVYEPDVALTLNNLGVLYQSVYAFDKSEKAYQRALEIRERLSRQTPMVHEPHLATVLGNLGNLYHSTNAFDLSEKVYLRALEINGRLAEANPALYEPDIALIQNNLGNLYRDKNDYSRALAASQKALEVEERLAQKNPAVYETDVAMTLNNLGVIHKALQQFPQAEAMYQRALTIRERLAKKHPEIHLPFVAMIENNLSALYLSEKKYDKAEAAQKKALVLYSHLSKTHPALYEPDIALTYHNMGVLYQATQNLAEAEKVLRKALEIRERLAKTDPDTYQPDVALSQNNLGNLYRTRKDFRAAEVLYTKALASQENLVQKHPDVYELEYCRTLTMLCLLYEEEKEANPQKKGIGSPQKYVDKLLVISQKYLDHPLGKQMNEYANYLNDALKEQKTGNHE